MADYAKQPVRRLQQAWTVNLSFSLYLARSFARSLSHARTQAHTQRDIWPLNKNSEEMFIIIYYKNNKSAHTQCFSPCFQQRHSHSSSLPSLVSILMVSGMVHCFFFFFKDRSGLRLSSDLQCQGPVYSP